MMGPPDDDGFDDLWLYREEEGGEYLFGPELSPSDIIFTILSFSLLPIPWR
jgi:hypothetical protein